MFLLKKAFAKKLLPTHIGHIYLCLLTHKLTQKQSQASEISQRLIPTFVEIYSIA
jgi:hypothetical protein